MWAVEVSYLRGTNSGIHPVRQWMMLKSSSSLLEFRTTLNRVTITTTSRFVYATLFYYMSTGRRKNRPWINVHQDQDGVRDPEIQLDVTRQAASNFVMWQFERIKWLCACSVAYCSLSPSLSSGIQMAGCTNCASRDSAFKQSSSY